MILKTPIVVESAKQHLLKGDVWVASDDSALFHLTRERPYPNKRLFEECEYLNIHIDHRVKWGAPIPSTFQAFLPDILRILVPSECTLMLNIVDLHQGFFDQAKFFKEIVIPRGLRYEWVEKTVDSQNISTLIFECPLEELPSFIGPAFRGVVTEIEGFAMPEASVRLFGKWQEMGNTAEMFRDLIRNVHFAFRLWIDHNGMLVVSDKFDVQELREKLSASNLVDKINDYIETSS